MNALALNIACSCGAQNRIVLDNQQPLRIKCPKCGSSRAEFKFNLPIRSEAELRLFVLLSLGISIPDVQVCPDHASPWSVFRDAYFAKESIIVLEGSRGFAGKSFLLAALSYVEAATLGCDVNILGGSGQQSANVKEYIGQFIRAPKAPRFEDGDAVSEAPTTYEIHFKRGNVIRALMASQTSVRGPHPQRLRMDECDEMAPDIFEAAMGQTMDRDAVPAQTILSSTHQYPDKTFSLILKRAEERGYPVRKICYKENMEPHGWLSAGMVEKKRREMSVAAWLSEVELQEPNPEDRAIFPEFVDQCFRNDHPWIQEALNANNNGVSERIAAHRVPFLLQSLAEDLDDQDGKLIIIESPDQHGDYAMGADWGKWRDYSVIVVLRTDVSPIRVVAFIRGRRRPYPIMANWLDDLIDLYGDSNSRRAHDGTGVGVGIADLLKHDVDAVTLTGAVRDDLFKNWIIALESMEVQGPRIKSFYSEHKFVGNGIFGGGEHPPDTFVAAALAWHARNQSRVMFL